MLAVALGANGHRVAVHIDVDVLFLEARQIGFQQIAVALVLNIGLKLAQAAAPRAVAEKCALHLIPGIISRNVIVSAFKRSQFKHNTKPPNLFGRAALAARVVYISFVPLGTILSIVTPCEQKYIF